MGAKQGWHSTASCRSRCSTPSVPAPELERFVVDQVKSIGNDTNLLADTLAECRRRKREPAKAHAQIVRRFTVCGCMSVQSSWSSPNRTTSTASLRSEKMTYMAPSWSMVWG